MATLNIPQLGNRYKRKRMRSNSQTEPVKGVLNLGPGKAATRAKSDTGGEASKPVGSLITFLRMEYLLEQHQYAIKPLPPLPDAQECTIPGEIEEKSKKLEELLQNTLQSPNSMISVQNLRIETLLNTVHTQEKEIARLKANQQDSPSSETSIIPPDIEQLLIIKSVNAKLNMELKNSFVALKIAHSQLLAERKKNLLLQEAIDKFNTNTNKEKELLDSEVPKSEETLCKQTEEKMKDLEDQ